MVIGKTVLISGGSSGIGFTISRYFANAGYKLLWVSLLKEGIKASTMQLQKEVPNCELNYTVQDLSLSNAAQKVYDWVQENQWDVDVLINNVGLGTYGFINDIDSKRELNMIDVNITNLYKMTRFF